MSQYVIPCVDSEYSARLFQRSFERAVSYVLRGQKRRTNYLNSLGPNPLSQNYFLWAVAMNQLVRLVFCILS